MEFQKNKEDEAALQLVENEGFKNVKKCMLRLYNIWDDFGIDKAQKSHRANSVWVHILNLVKDILEEEASLHKEAIERIEVYQLKIKELSSVLSVKPRNISEASLIKKEELLSLEFENLCELKNKIIEDYQHLKKSELEYCQILNFPGHKLIHESGIPTEKDIIDIKQHIEMMREEKQKRLKRFNLMKRELKTIMEDIELAPETSLEKQFFSVVETFSLSNETFHSLEEVIDKVQHKKTELEVQRKNFLKKLTALWGRLQIEENEREKFLSENADCRISTLKNIQQELDRCEAIKMTKMKQFIDSLQKELIELWDKCHISEAFRQEFNCSSITEFNSETLEAYESEVEKYKKYYEDVEHIFKKILKREELRRLKIVFENKAADPNRFKNRKGNLLQEEKERKKLQRDLPVLEASIIKDIEEYETLHSCKFFYDGEDYRTLIVSQLGDKNEKTKKDFGLHLQPNAISSTPRKRPPSAAPNSAPGKLLKTNSEVPLASTPAHKAYKMLPKSVGKSLTLQHHKFGAKKKNICNNNQKMVLKERNQPNNVEMKSSPNGTTYPDFANVLNSPARHYLRSSVLATRRPTGTRTSKKSLKGRKKITSSQSSRFSSLNNSTSNHSSGEN